MIYNFIFSSAIILILLILLCIGINPNKSDKEAILLQRFNNLRGFFAIEIIIGHVIRYENTILYPLGKFMIISVAFFFFVSAFGLSYSFRTKENYLKTFIRNKCCYLFILIVVTYCFNIFISLFVPIKTAYYIRSINFFHFFHMTNWYLWELLFFYVLFYIIYRFASRYGWLYLFLISAVLIALLYKTGWAEGWYASALAFPFGLFYEKYYEKFNNFIRSKKGIVLALLSVCLGLYSQFLGQDSVIGMVYLRNIMCIAGLLILIYILHVVEINNYGLQILTRYSTELYLFQFIYLRISEAYQWDYKIRMLFVIALTGITALFMHSFLSKIAVYIKKA